MAFIAAATPVTVPGVVLADEEPFNGFGLQ